MCSQQFSPYGDLTLTLSIEPRRVPTVAAIAVVQKCSLSLTVAQCRNPIRISIAHTSDQCCGATCVKPTARVTSLARTQTKTYKMTTRTMDPNSMINRVRRTLSIALRDENYYMAHQLYKSLCARYVTRPLWLVLTPPVPVVNCAGKLRWHGWGPAGAPLIMLLLAYIN